MNLADLTSEEFPIDKILFDRWVNYVFEFEYTN